MKKLHDNKIIHNDIHGNNIMFSKKTYNLKLIDFGLSIEMPDNVNVDKLLRKYYKNRIEKYTWFPEFIEILFNYPTQDNPYFIICKKNEDFKRNISSYRKKSDVIKKIADDLKKKKEIQSDSFLLAVLSIDNSKDYINIFPKEFLKDYKHILENTYYVNDKYGEKCVIQSNAFLIFEHYKC